MHKSSSKFRFNFVAGALVLSLTAVASAHPGHGGLVAGLEHPVTGLDHLLAMVGVGLLAVGYGKRALWMLPLTFVGFMVAGALAGASGLLMPSWMAEQGIALSVIVVGAMIVLGAKIPQTLAMALVAVFALCHGSAHAAEMPAGQSMVGFFAGFIASTALLHAGGIGAGLLLAANVKSADALRWSGAAISLAGLLMVVGVL